MPGGKYNKGIRDHPFFKEDYYTQLTNKRREKSWQYNLVITAREICRDLGEMVITSEIIKNPEQLYPKDENVLIKKGAKEIIKNINLW
jgi:hypothetical protein